MTNREEFERRLNGTLYYKCEKCFGQWNRVDHRKLHQLEALALWGGFAALFLNAFRYDFKSIGLHFLFGFGMLCSILFPDIISGKR